MNWLKFWISISINISQATGIFQGLGQCALSSVHKSHYAQKDWCNVCSPCFERTSYSKFLFCSPCALNHFCIAEILKTFLPVLITASKTPILEWQRWIVQYWRVTEVEVKGALLLPWQLWSGFLWDVQHSLLLAVLLELSSDSVNSSYWSTQLIIIRTKLRRPTQMPKITKAHACEEKKSKN